MDFLALKESGYDLLYGTEHHIRLLSEACSFQVLWDAGWNFGSPSPFHERATPSSTVGVVENDGQNMTLGRVVLDCTRLRWY